MQLDKRVSMYRQTDVQTDGQTTSHAQVTVLMCCTCAGVVLYTYAGVVLYLYSVYLSWRGTVYLYSVYLCRRGTVYLYSVYLCRRGTVYLCWCGVIPV